MFGDPAKTEWLSFFKSDNPLARPELMSRQRGAIELADFTAACGQVASGLLATSHQLGGVLRGSTARAFELSTFAAGKGVGLARSATHSLVGTGERVQVKSMNVLGCCCCCRCRRKCGCCPWLAAGYLPRPLPVSPDLPSSEPQPPQGGEAHKQQPAAMERD